MANLYWDPSGTRVDGIISGGSGFASNAETYWTNTLGDAALTPVEDDTLYFTGLSGDVMIGDGWTPERNLYIQTDGYRFMGGAIELDNDSSYDVVYFQIGDRDGPAITFFVENSFTAMNSTNNALGFRGAVGNGTASTVQFTGTTDVRQFALSNNIEFQNNGIVEATSGLFFYNDSYFNNLGTVITSSIYLSDQSFFENHTTVEAVVRRSEGTFINHENAFIGTGTSPAFSLGASDADPFLLINRGQILGDIELRYSRTEIRDHQSEVRLEGGHVVGDITLGNDNDIFHAIGDATYAGSVFAGTGDDVLTGARQDDDFFGGSGNDTIDGLSGDDTISGGDGDDVIFGRSGYDSIRANNGDDTINGGTGRDTIIGGEGDDLIVGETGSDSLSGNAGNDSIYGNEGSDSLYGHNGDDMLYGGFGHDQMIGGNGADKLRGANGNDTLNGGLGADTLNGGAGNDVFEFTYVSHLTGPTGAMETIESFVSGSDIIDLSAIDAVAGGIDDAFTFRGTDTYTGTAGEIRIFERPDGLVLRFDLDGDRTTDRTLLVQDVTSLSETDFIL
ncbi:calcium-binding protein [uncultured Sulfitobacter sp.]|uniref:calcium-binding protein n=1 Tax=uncultured Sulfitobacter sp. TaxID=191468 RepID=UPI002616E601|nr:calcium-binding protein [uncultured Sulfitobacter sp.]